MFEFSTVLTNLSLEALKREIQKQINFVKSSHRCEALARGLGFRTYAALKVTLEREEERRHNVDGAAFCAYLSSRGFEVCPTVFYHAAVILALRNIMERVPTLTVNGVGFGQPQIMDSGRREGQQEQFARFERDRANLCSSGLAVSFLLSLAFLSRVVQTKTVRPKSDSYWLKHIAENYKCTYPEGIPLGPLYVPNGIFIAAAIYAGFDFRSYELENGYESQNVTFNMAHDGLVDLDCEIRPTGAHAESRRQREAQRVRGSLRSTYY